MAVIETQERHEHLVEELIADVSAYKTDVDDDLLRSVKRMIEADMRFHRFLYDLSGNPMIAETASLHWHHIRRLIGGYLQHYPMRDVWDEHQAILDAVIAGDPDRAEAAARHHADHASMKFAGLVRATDGPEASTAGTPTSTRRKRS